jgi:hypothetical protein
MWGEVIMRQPLYAASQVAHERYAPICDQHVRQHAQRCQRRG